MIEPLRFAGGVMLVGGGEVDDRAIAMAAAVTTHVVAADGGANGLAGRVPRLDAIIGDLDSLEDRVGWAARGTRVLHLSEQDTTDLEKCLYATEAPFYIGVGFTGRRLDHTLAVLHVMLRRAEKPLVLIGAEDVVFLAPPEWRITLAEGARVSFFPLRPVSGVASTGLEWPIDGLAMAAGAMIGTSNRATGPLISACFDGPGVVTMVERQYLDAVLVSLGLCAGSTAVSGSGSGPR